MSERVVVTGLGAVTPLGIGVGPMWSSLLEGKSGASPITLFDAARFATRFACEVKNWDPSAFMDKKRTREMDRFSQFAFAAARMAVEDAGLELAEAEQRRAGCLLGVGMGGLVTLGDVEHTLQHKGPERLSPYSIPRILGNLAAGQISIAHGLRGPTYSTTSACATGAHAIGEALEWIRRGRADVMLAGGAEAAVTPVGIGGFQAMHALSRRNEAPELASRPFDRGRDGFVCGEGSGVLVLESLTRAKRRGARIHAELTGYGASSDAFHITNPPPDGDGCQAAMRDALADARIAVDQVSYLNAHATSTGAGDRAEARGIAAVFGERVRDGGLWISSTKSMTGHLLGAAGAVEAIISVLAISTGRVPPTINLDDPDPECPIDVVGGQARTRRLEHVLSNAFGFGGTNATLVFSAV